MVTVGLTLGEKVQWYIIMIMHRMYVSCVCVCVCVKHYHSFLKIESIKLRLVRIYILDDISALTVQF